MIFRAEAAATAAQGAMPTVVFGLIAFSVFIVLGFITYSYRDVANRSVAKGSDHQGHH